MSRHPVKHTLSHDGLAFVVRGWPGPAPSRTALVIHHGHGEHGGRYDPFARRLEGLPLDVWAFDLRGHGETGGPRGHALGVGQLAADFHALLPRIRELAGAERVIVLGHSLGAATVAAWACDHPSPPEVRALMLSAAPLHIPRTFSVRAKELLARGLARAAPGFTLGTALPATGISSDPAEVRRYESDPLVHDRISAALGLSLLREAPRVVERLGSVRLPALVWHGSDDPIASIQGSRDLFAALGSSDKTFHELPGYRHEAHHETPERVDRLFELLTAWLEPHLLR
jgi:alpha-beta hydrolase superfamily lysophospholipase